MKKLIYLVSVATAVSMHKEKLTELPTAIRYPQALWIAHLEALGFALREEAILLILAREVIKG
jgi:hypothetical protein